MSRTYSQSTNKKYMQRRERRQPFAETIAKPTKARIGRSTAAYTPLYLQGRGFELDDVTRMYLRRHVSFKLSKFALNVTGITVRLERTALNKSTGYECRFKIDVPDLPSLVVAAHEPNLHAAFSLAVGAAERTLRRRLQRKRRSRHTHSDVRH